MLLVLLTTYWCCLYISLRGVNLILVPIVPEISGTIFPENFRNDIPEHSGKKIVPEIVPEFRISGTFSIIEMEKNFRIISVRKPYRKPGIPVETG